MQKRASQVLSHQKRASQVLIYQKTVQKRATTCKNVQKRASQIFLDPIQKRAPARSVHLEAVYLEALLYPKQPTKPGVLVLSLQFLHFVLP